MSTEKVIADLERTIRKVCKDIKKRNGSVGGDKLDSLSKLVNSYSRLIERSQDSNGEDETKSLSYAEILEQSVKN